MSRDQQESRRRPPFGLYDIFLEAERDESTSIFPLVAGINGPRLSCDAAQHGIDQSAGSAIDCIDEPVVRAMRLAGNHPQARGRTKNAIDAYRQAVAASVSTWKSSWYPKTRGAGSGQRCM
jgi:hypothetical protein